MFTTATATHLVGVVAGAAVAAVAVEGSSARLLRALPIPAVAAAARCIKVALTVLAVQA
jgi:hypothetical protein